MNVINRINVMNRLIAIKRMNAMDVINRMNVIYIQNEFTINYKQMLPIPITQFAEKSHFINSFFHLYIKIEIIGKF